MRKITDIDADCAQAVLELGRKTYHRHLLDKEVEELNAKVYALNIEAFQVREALKAAQEQLAAETSTDQVPAAEVTNVE